MIEHFWTRAPLLAINFCCPHYAVLEVDKEVEEKGMLR